MRWPWQQAERRESSGGYTDIIGRLIEAQASGNGANTSSTAAIEAASGALSRSLAAAQVDGPDWAREAITGRVLGQIGRDLIRNGESLHVLRLGRDGGVRLVTATSWYLEGSVDPDDWHCTATCYGPSGSMTWRVPWESVVFVAWGSPTARPYHGIGPAGWASTTARLQAEVERSLADEVQGPLAQLLAVPQDGGDGTDDDPLKMLKTEIAAARGKAMLVESTAAAWDTGKAAAPQRDWQANRLGPQPPDSMAIIADAAFARMLAACGCSPALFDDSDGTSKREALRQWHLGTVKPLARLLETELSEKLDAPIKLGFDLYNVDLAGRAQAFQKLVAGGVAVNEALATSGLLVGDDA